jgi:hypothetical protein
VAIRGTGAAGVKNEVAQSAWQASKTDLKFEKPWERRSVQPNIACLPRVHVGDLKDLPHVEVGAVEIRLSPAEVWSPPTRPETNCPPSSFAPGNVPKTLHPPCRETSAKAYVWSFGQFGLSGGIVHHLIRHARGEDRGRDPRPDPDRVQNPRAPGGDGSGEVLNDKTYAEATAK